MYRIDRYGETIYGATYHLRPLYLHWWVTAHLLGWLFSWWWNVEVEKV